MESGLLQVDFDRLQGDIEQLATIGRNADLGLYRMAFSDGDMAAREWLRTRIEEAGLDYHLDGAANVYGRLHWDAARPSVMIGSHIDTVPGAGHLDGALGVMVGLECLRRIRELDLPTRHPLELVAFTDEEGRFGGMFGSEAVSGRLTPERIHQARDLDGVSLVDAMARRGLNAMDALKARRRPETLRAFLELHIEQGPVLDNAGKVIGAVEGIVGLFRWNARLIGTANHAGTTPMHLRQDAFQGLAELAGAIPRILEEHGTPRSVATIGRVELTPGAANVVPGKAEFALEARDLDAGALAGLGDALRRAAAAIARRRGLMFEFEITSELEPVRCDPGVIELIEAVSTELGVSHLRMSSGAAHDTQMMAGLTRSGMIFVPSKGGRSHSPAEWTPWEDIHAGANVALNTLYRLAH